MFDRVLLMAEGRVAFLGGITEAMTFFQNIQLPCPTNFNPADHYIHVLAVTPGNEEECRRQINSVCDTFHESSIGRQVEAEVNYQIENVTEETKQELSKVNQRKSPYKASWLEQFRAVFWRSLLAVVKEPMIMQVIINFKTSSES